MATWMVVEDEPDIYAVLLAMFQAWGIAGAAFVDGPEAISWIDDVDAGRVKTDLPELAVIDIRLPVGSGVEVAARLRQSPILQNIAIVLITAHHLPPAEYDEAMAESQADLLLYKPLPRADEFRAYLEDAIARRAEMAEELEALAEESVPSAPADDEAIEETEQVDTESVLDELETPAPPPELPEADELLAMADAFVPDEFEFDFDPETEPYHIDDLGFLMDFDFPIPEEATEPVDTGGDDQSAEDEPPQV
ncbi:MAG: hypothetical protein Kow0077_05990 [Anaerolineae bacterium]